MMIRNMSLRAFRAPTTLSRLIHTVPKLAHQAEYESQGIPGLYSPSGFQDVWTQYQQVLVNSLSRMTADTEHETRTPFGVMLNTARDRLQAGTFNVASQAHNNHLFVQALRPSAGNETRPSVALDRVIVRDFGSLEALKQEVFTLAQESVGNGWLFVVEAADKHLYLQFSNGAGTPYFVGRQQLYNLNTPMSAEIEETLDEVRASLDAKEHIYNMPLLCINLWENAYITDFGIDGKQKYLESVWNSLNWDVISARHFNL